MKGPGRLKNFIIVELSPSDIPLPLIFTGGPSINFSSSSAGIVAYVSPGVCVEGSILIRAHPGEIATYAGSTTPV